MNFDTTTKSAVNKSQKSKIVDEIKDKDSYIMFDVELNNTKPNKEN